jgi:hypothetical protein
MRLPATAREPEAIAPDRLNFCTGTLPADFEEETAPFIFRAGGLDLRGARKKGWGIKGIAIKPRCKAWEQSW